jgi:hypothetical protein
MEIKRDLYVVATVDKDGHVISYPKGGGSSAPAYIRAFESLKSAKRSQARLGGTVLRVVEFEEAD